MTEAEANPTLRAERKFDPLSRSSARRGLGGLVLVAILGTSAGVAAGATFKVGSFTKTTTGAPVTQAVAHGLGETPKALILWTNGKTNETLGANFLFAFGVSDTTTSKSVATSSADAVGTTDGNRRMANKALTIINSAGTLNAEADVQSVDTTNFTLNWTTNNGTGYVIHFLAIGGTEVSAKALGWTMATATGNQSVTGFGFKPTVVISANLGAAFTSAPPTTSSHSPFGLSVMDGSGGQWSNSLFSKDAATPSDTMRYQRVDKGFVVVATTLTLTKEATWVSMDTNGFTINYTTANASAGQVISLGLAGIQAQAGSFTKATGAQPASQAVTGVRFRPKMVLLSSAQNAASTSLLNHARFGIGATDGTTEGSAAYQDTNGLGTSSTDGVDKTSKVFVKVDNDTQTVNAEADTTSLDAAGFTLDWTTNDAVATEIAYLALAGPRRVMLVSSSNPMDQ